MYSECLSPMPSMFHEPLECSLASCVVDGVVVQSCGCTYECSFGGNCVKLTGEEVLCRTDLCWVVTNDCFATRLDGTEDHCHDLGRSEQCKVIVRVSCCYTCSVVCHNQSPQFFFRQVFHCDVAGKVLTVFYLCMLLEC